MFSCWMYFYEILTRTKTHRHSMAMLLITYKFWTQNLVLRAVGLGRSTRVSMCVRVCAHAWAGSTPLLRRGCSLVKPSSSFGFAFGRFSAHPPAGGTGGGSLCASLISSWVSFSLFFKQLFETTTGILSIISWKFVVVCLKYDWLYTIVLTFQTALSTFILITHLCIDFFFLLKMLVVKDTDTQYA